MVLIDDERQMLFRCAARLGSMDAFAIERTDQHIVMTVLDAFDPAGEISGDLSKTDREGILASYFAGRSVLEF